MAGEFTALRVRLINSRDELRDGEEYTYCARCKHMAAVNLRSPEVWQSGAVPYCIDCIFTKLQEATEEVAQINAEREQHMRGYRRWILFGRVLYWVGGAVFAIQAAWNIETSQYGWATVFGLLAAFYTWRFVTLFGDKYTNP